VSPRPRLPLHLVLTADLLAGTTTRCLLCGRRVAFAVAANDACADSELARAVMIRTLPHRWADCRERGPSKAG
jgi:hypothetical protein